MIVFRKNILKITPVRLAQISALCLLMTAQAAYSDQETTQSPAQVRGRTKTANTSLWEKQTTPTYWLNAHQARTHTLGHFAKLQSVLIRSISRDSLRYLETLIKESPDIKAHLAPNGKPFYRREDVNEHIKKQFVIWMKSILAEKSSTDSRAKQLISDVEMHLSESRMTTLAHVAQCLASHLEQINAPATD